MRYIGRFAPSPTGPLHLGSLVAAVGSYCDARAAGGQWLLRMEDIDPPRMMPGAADTILRQLEAYGFEWDGGVLWQSTRSEAYLAALEQLRAQGDVFWCCCSRAELARLGASAYPGLCRAFTSPRENAALRLRVPDGIQHFRDLVLGKQSENVREVVGDFVLRRRDGLFSYQLAVVVDDAAQGITRVVRGADLLDNTARQIVLQRLLGVPTPEYLHLPLAVHADGSKLSKQTHAGALPLPPAPDLLWLVLRQLGQEVAPGMPPLPAREILAWGIRHWQPQAIPWQPFLANGGG
ncbi:MAG: Glutamyl/glutaminyl-tRNA synthetase, class Ic, catalytic domain protein [Moraxellaceae bacterium]|jgi:glutamyl-Q tRNA(Asp) synthetase|nr:Glutamyl/glutaminyl-tRNA synthetase, class Ic, catalytic domain protein [Moraxellaceae bacterium]